MEPRRERDTARPEVASDELAPPARPDVEQGHDHKPKSRRAMVIAFALTSLFMLAELVGGIVANSLALVADAGHMVSDAAALALGLLAMWMASHPHMGRRTFGFHRAEILAALANGALLVGIASFVAWHAVERLSSTQQVASGPMMIIAALGLFVNLVALRVLGAHRHDSLNVRGAFLHVVSDALGSVGVLVAGAVIYWTGWTRIDAVVGLVIAVLIFASGARLLRETISVLLESSPRHLDLDALREDLVALPGVRDVHDLHVWTVTSGFVSLSCHAQVSSSDLADDVLRRATMLLKDRYGIRHVTIQPETSVVHDELEHCCSDNHDSTPSLRRFLNQS